MLVCNVSLLTRRGVIAAGITEAASAQDRPGTGNVVFATLVDDPAAVLDRVDAYFGQIIVEATNATANANAGLIVASTVVEVGECRRTVFSCRSWHRGRGDGGIGQCDRYG